MFTPLLLFDVYTVFTDVSLLFHPQVFYCETRKRVVPLNYENFEMPGWMTMLIGTSTMEVNRNIYSEYFRTWTLDINNIIFNIVFVITIQYCCYWP